MFVLYSQPFIYYWRSGIGAKIQFEAKLITIITFSPQIKAKEEEFDNTKRQLQIQTSTQKVIYHPDLPEAMNTPTCAAYNKNHAMICALRDGKRQACYTAFSDSQPANLEFTKVSSVHDNYVRRGMAHYKHNPIIFCE